MLVETYKIKGWKKRETGLLVAENKDWILVKYIAEDYLIDGYKLFQKKYIKKRMSGAEEKLQARVLKLKKVKATNPKKFKFGSTSNVLKWVEKNYGLFEFQDNEEKELFFGKINQIKGDELIIDMINTEGGIEKNDNWVFSLKKIRSITFDSDYFRSLILLMNDKKK